MLTFADQNLKAMKKQTFNVKGMKCMGCVANVEKTLKALNGVNTVNVDLKAQTAEVEYDENTTGFATMKEAITGIGFEMTE